MKNFYVYVCLFFPSILIGQVDLKDTLYIIDETNFLWVKEKIRPQDYKKLEFSTTSYLGRVVYEIDSTYENLKPNRIDTLSSLLNDKKFHLPGYYSIIGNRYRIESELDRYNIFLVRDGKYVKIKKLRYLNIPPPSKGITTQDRLVKDTVLIMRNSIGLKRKNSPGSREYILPFAGYNGTILLREIRPSKIDHVNNFISLDDIVNPFVLSEYGNIDNEKLLSILTKYEIILQDNDKYYLLNPILKAH